MSIFKDKVLLITGGTGSFGNAVLRRFLDSDMNAGKRIEIQVQVYALCISLPLGKIRSRIICGPSCGRIHYIAGADGVL